MVMDFPEGAGEGPGRGVTLGLWGWRAAMQGSGNDRSKRCKMLTSSILQSNPDTVLSPLFSTIGVPFYTAAAFSALQAEAAPWNPEKGNLGTPGRAPFGRLSSLVDASGTSLVYVKIA